MDLLTLYLSILLLIKIKSQPQSETQPQPESSCKYINNCFECNAAKDNKCKWNLNSCNGNKESSSNEDLIQRMLYCYDNIESIKSITDQYCGDLNINLVDKDITLNLPKNGNEYGLSNLICRYTITNSKEDKTYYIKIKQKFKSGPSIILNVTQSSNQDPILVKEQDTEYQLSKKEIYINVYTYTSYSDNPFDITLSYSNSNGNKKIIIILCLCVIAIIIILFIIFVFLYKKKRTDAIIVANILDEEEKKFKKQLRKIAEKEFNTFIPKKFSDVKDNDFVSCGICMEDFKSDDIISFTICKHIFHYNCLKNWFLPLESDEVHNTCPECRKELFQLKYDNMKNQNNNNNSNSNNNINSDNSINNNNSNNSNNNINLIQVARNNNSNNAFPIENNQIDNNAPPIPIGNNQNYSNNILQIPFGNNQRIMNNAPTPAAIN